MGLLCMENICSTTLEKIIAMHNVFSLSVIACICVTWASTKGSLHERTVTVVSINNGDADIPSVDEEYPLPAAHSGLPANKLYDIGETFLMNGQPGSALPYLKRGAEHMKGDPFAQGNYAIALHQIEETIRSLRISLRLDETQVSSLALSMQLEHYTTEILAHYHLKYARARRLLDTALSQAESGGLSLLDVWTPSQVVQLDVHPRDVLRLCRLYAADASAKAAAVARAAGIPADAGRVLPRRAPADPGAGGRLRVGYVSYSFGLGVRNGLMYNVFSAHDRQQVEVWGYAIRPHDEDADEEERKRVERNVEHFVDISRVGMYQVAEVINGGGKPHVLVDLLGLHSNGTALYRIYAGLPAPVQVLILVSLVPPDFVVAYMAFAATTGADFMHLLATDKFTSPPEYRVDYAEGLLYLPFSYHVNSHALRFPNPKSRPADTTALVSERAAQKLPTTAVPPDETQLAAGVGLQNRSETSGRAATLLCSYNQFFKLDPGVVGGWAAALRASPSAYMLVVELIFHEYAIPRLRRELAARGVNAVDKRVLGISKLPTAAHLSRSSLLDLHLDTRLQGGHTTSVDALWAGTPILLLPSRSMVSRAAVGIAAAAGLLGWSVARNTVDYALLAARLAGHPKALSMARRATMAAVRPHRAASENVSEGADSDPSVKISAGGGASEAATAPGSVGCRLFDLKGWVRRWELGLRLAWMARDEAATGRRRRSSAGTTLRRHVIAHVDE